MKSFSVFSRAVGNSTAGEKMKRIYTPHIDCVGIFFTMLHRKHSLRHGNCKGLPKKINKVREQKKNRTRSPSYWDFKNLFIRLLKESKLFWAGKQEDGSWFHKWPVRTENSVSDLECECVQCWHDSMSIDWLCEYFWKRLRVWEQSHLAQSCICRSTCSICRRDWVKPHLV